MKKVQVLISTYNGEKYLVEQLESILKQDYENISILIRDDGSSDKTIEILERYTRQYSSIQFYKGSNIGVINSFFDLFKNADPTADYYSLSDQDDVWLSNKISRAVEMLEMIDDENKPLLYCGRTTLVDNHLQPIQSSIKPHVVTPSFGNALVENVCTGCTSVMNRQLQHIVKEHIPEFTIMHDWWLYLSASAFGEVIYDNVSCILYRQHDKNVIGTQTTYYREFIKRIRNFNNNQGRISKQLRGFLKVYQLDDNKNTLINYVIHSKKRLSYRFGILRCKEIYRQRTMDNVIFKVLFLLGRI